MRSLIFLIDGHQHGTQIVLANMVLPIPIKGDIIQIPDLEDNYMVLDRVISFPPEISDVVLWCTKR